MILTNVNSAGNGKPNAIALTRAAASRNKGVVAKVRWETNKYVQQLRGTRKGGGVFDAAGKTRAIYVVKNEEWCVLRYWLLGCMFLIVGFKGLIIMNYFEFSEVPKQRMMNGRLCSCTRLQTVLIASAKE